MSRIIGIELQNIYVSVATHDLCQLVTKHFAELGEITKKLNQALEDKKILEQTRRDANTEYERKNPNKEILKLTRALTIMRKIRLSGTHG